MLRGKSFATQMRSAYQNSRDRFLPECPLIPPTNNFCAGRWIWLAPGIGLASPNPYVGAVIADPDGKIVGTGIYTYDGVKHAEILALGSSRRKSSRRHPLHQPRAARASGPHAALHRCADRSGNPARRRFHARSQS